MAKSHQTFHKRQRERVLREKAERKRERREQRRNEKKESQAVVPQPSAIKLTWTGGESAAGDKPAGVQLPDAHLGLSMRPLRFSLSAYKEVATCRGRQEAVFNPGRRELNLICSA